MLETHEHLWVKVGDFAISHSKGWTVTATTLTLSEFLSKMEDFHKTDPKGQQEFQSELGEWCDWMMTGCYAVSLTKPGYDDLNMRFFPSDSLHEFGEPDLYKFMAHSNPDDYTMEPEE